MYFNSYGFILAFLPLTVLGYFLLNKLKTRTFGNVWLLAASMFFYLFYSVKMSLVLLFSLVFNYLTSLRIRRNREKRKAAKAAVIIGVIVDVLLLFVFKYAATCAGLIASATKTDPLISSILVPVGISFFTFSQISFLIDTYRKEAPDCSVLDYALYVLLFIKILSGPIVPADKMVPSFTTRTESTFRRTIFPRACMPFHSVLPKRF